MSTLDKLLLILKNDTVVNGDIVESDNERGNKRHEAHSGRFAKKDGSGEENTVAPRWHLKSKKLLETQGRTMTLGQLNSLLSGVSQDEKDWTGLSEFMSQYKDKDPNTKIDTKSVLNAIQPPQLNEVEHSGEDRRYAEYTYPKTDGDSGRKNTTYKELLFTVDNADKKRILGSEMEWGSQPHWYEPDVVGHVRYDTREVDGKDTLFLHEVQSDAHEYALRKNDNNERLGYAPSKLDQYNGVKPPPPPPPPKEESEYKQLKKQVEQLEGALIYEGSKHEKPISFDTISGDIAAVDMQRHTFSDPDDSSAPYTTKAFMQFEIQGARGRMFNIYMDKNGSMYDNTYGRPFTQDFQDALGIHLDPEFLKKVQPLMAQYEDTYGKYAKIRDDEDAQREEEMDQGFDRNDEEFPPIRMPLRTSWPTTFMRRMVRMAAEKGLEQIAWTDGKAQSDLYNLGRDYKSLTISPSGDKVRILAEGHKGEKLEHVVPPSKLRDYVGKGIADQYKGEKFEVKGRDFNIGSVGMTNFYDKDLPSIANSIGKPHGVVAEKQPYGKDGSIWVMPLPKKLRDDVLNKGMPLFKSMMILRSIK